MKICENGGWNAFYKYVRIYTHSSYNNDDDTTHCLLRKVHKAQVELKGLIWYVCASKRNERIFFYSYIKKTEMKMKMMMEKDVDFNEK